MVPLIIYVNPVKPIILIIMTAMESLFVAVVQPIAQSAMMLILVNNAMLPTILTILVAYKHVLQEHTQIQGIVTLLLNVKIVPLYVHLVHHPLHAKVALVVIL